MAASRGAQCLFVWCAMAVGLGLGLWVCHVVVHDRVLLQPSSPAVSGAGLSEPFEPLASTSTSPSPPPPAPNAPSDIAGIFGDITPSTTAPPPLPPLSPSLSPSPSGPNPPWRTGRGEDSFDPDQKYLFYERHYNDFFAGVSHRRWSYTCMAGEALLLRRIFVLDLEVGVVSVHNDGNDSITPFALYFDLERTRKTLPIIDMKVFLDGWAKWAALRPENNFSVLEAPITNGPPFEEIQKSNATIVYRSYGESDYGFHVCMQNPTIERPYGAFLFSPSLLKIAYTILDDMKYYFVALHVRRGDKVKHPDMWPHLDEDTSPPHLLEVLQKRNISTGRTIYIATNEKQPGFFAPLSAHYRVRQLSDFRYLWEEGSEWWKEAKAIVGEEKEPKFDGMMAGIVDYTIMEFTKVRIETFNDLTDAPKNGVPTSN